MKLTRALAIGTFSLVSIVGCGTHSKSIRPCEPEPYVVQTDTLEIIGGRETIKIPGYDIDNVIIGNRFYCAKPLPQGMTAKIGDEILDRSVIVDFTLIPEDKSCERVTSAGATLSPIGEQYALINLILRADLITINKTSSLEKIRVVYSVAPIKSRSIKDQFDIVKKRKVLLSTDDLERVSLNAQTFYKFPADHSKIKDALNSSFVIFGAEPIVEIQRNGENEQTKRTLQGFVYIPIKCDLVQIPLPETKQPQAPSVIEYQDSIDTANK